MALLCICLFCTKITASEGISGKVIDRDTRESLIGAAVMTGDGARGTVTSIDGDFYLELADGTHRIEASFIGYKTLVFEIRLQEGKLTLLSQNYDGVTNFNGVLNLELQADETLLSDAVVTGRKNMESLNALRSERIASAFSIENLGAKEMALKGLSNVQESVVKMSGISIADAGQLVVRGLGDRYSTTTLNGMPIASPNPDNKLIPLDIFPSSTVRNITVSKVYEASSFADYSGAHIDISTKRGASEDFLTITAGTGGLFGTVFTDSYRMISPSIFTTPLLDAGAENLSHSEFKDYALSKDLFAGSPFTVQRRKALPDLNVSLGFGKTFNIGSQQMSITASAGVKTSESSVKDAYQNTYEASGTRKSWFRYNSWSQDADAVALLDIEQTLRENDWLVFSGFFARNASRSFAKRIGTDYEDRNLFGETQTDHIYMLGNMQLGGHHENGAWKTDWGVSASLTSSDEPDRRQMLFQEGEDGLLRFFTNNMETYRYFGKLRENEYTADLKSSRNFKDGSKLRFGLTAKYKSRNFSVTRFLYDVSSITATFTPDIMMDINPYVGFDAVSSGSINMNRKQNARDKYEAYEFIGAAFAEWDKSFGDKWFLNLGLRFEGSLCRVDYNDDVEDTSRTLPAYDPFFALNLKYNVTGGHFLRLALSRTITRPSFIEMAPFLYQESYGGAMLRGNASLQNAYNYNADLKYEFFSESGNSDMFSVTAYFKWLQHPIERIQRYSGGAPEHSFQNAENGLAAGAEAEFRKMIVKDLHISANASYMYTSVKLPEGGIYTNPERGLQGASPYLVNIDLTYNPSFDNGSSISLALLYNLQGPRIHSVGLSGLGDVKQMPFHSLNFNASYAINRHFTLTFALDNLIDCEMRFRQDVPATSEIVDVEGWRKGRGILLSLKWSL